MSITQETANLIDTLAHAASMIGSTDASAKLNKVIVDLMPSTTAEELASLQISAHIMADKLELLRGRMAEITLIASEILPLIDDPEIPDALNRIITLAAPSTDAPAA